MCAIVLVQGGDGSHGRYLVENLSAGGAVLSGEPAMPVRTRISLVLTLAGEHLASAEGTVIRETRGAGGAAEMGVAFSGLGARKYETLRIAVDRALKAKECGCPGVLIVAAQRGRILSALTRQMHALGHQVVDVRSLEQAAETMRNPSTRVDVVFLDLTHIDVARGLGFFRDLASASNAAKRVLVVREHPVEGLDSGDVGVAHVVLRFPWDASALCAAMNRDGPQGTPASLLPCDAAPSTTEITPDRASGPMEHAPAPRPLPPPEAGGESEKAPPEPAAAATRPSPTILLVDDEESFRSIMRRILRKGGYRVLEAASAQAALVLAEQERDPIDLLLTDLVMPHMGGAQLAMRMSAGRPTLKVLCVSGYPRDMVLRQQLLAPEFAFVEKSGIAETLLSTVRELMDSDE